MLQYEELRLRLIHHEKTLDDLSEALGLDKMKEEIAQLEKEQTVDGFWDDIAKMCIRDRIHSFYSGRYRNLLGHRGDRSCLLC